MKARVASAATMIAFAGVVPASIGCSLASSQRFESDATGSRVVNVVATLNVWGSILAQLGGAHVHATSLITRPGIDPHDYEPTPADARTIATARLVVTNGLGYDAWAAKAVAANADPRQVVADVGKVLGLRSDANPHRWYSPADVDKVAAAISADLARIDPSDAAYFDERRTAFETRALAPYHRLIDEIKATYGGTPVGASESVFAPMAAALGLDLSTPPGWLRAISEGSEPSAADKARADAQITSGRIKVYVVNSQNSTPDVAAQVSAARRRGIPVVSITETLSPATASFQDWQVAQLQVLLGALRQAIVR
jgi:zinc/manganese transport system substrate-binding protein